MNESDFFRTRLTHSLEVSQIAEGIAGRLNEEPDFREDPIDTRLCSTAALIHDLGHPPFGHNGERALDDAMREFGGFEGNAQTIRIVSRIEKKLKKVTAPSVGDREEYCDDDDRAGLGLTYRTILSALKYDKSISNVRSVGDPFEKGYYATEKRLIERAKAAVDPDRKSRPSFKTIECQIMDLADDIAYSIYDLEDTLKAGFITPSDIFAADEDIFKVVARKTNRALKGDFIDAHDAQAIFLEIFSLFPDEKSEKLDADSFVRTYRASRNLAEDAYSRTALSSSLVNAAIRSVTVTYKPEAPWLSDVALVPEMKKRVEVLKHFTYQSTIYSARVKVGEYRGYEVVRGIFRALADPKGMLLMPEDLRRQYREKEQDATARFRAICDFVAGMTDRYALEFHARLHSDDPQSIFKPV